MCSAQFKAQPLFEAAKYVDQIDEKRVHLGYPEVRRLHHACLVGLTRKGAAQEIVRASKKKAWTAGENGRKCTSNSGHQHKLARGLAAETSHQQQMLAGNRDLTVHTRVSQRCHCALFSVRLEPTRVRWYSDACKGRLCHKEDVQLGWICQHPSATLSLKRHVAVYIYTSPANAHSS